MKIWFPTIKAGSGVDVYVNRLAASLRKHGVAAEITWFDKRFEFAPLALMGTKPPQGTDIIHANSWNAFTFAHVGIPLVVTEHHCVVDPDFRPYKGFVQNMYHELLIKRYEAASFRKANRIIAVSHYTAAGLHRAFGLDSVEVIHNWLDTQVFQPGVSGQMPGNDFRLLYVGNHSRRKGWDLVKLIMNDLGDGYRIAVTAGMRSKNQVNNKSNFTSLGYLQTDNLVRAYQNCDALLFPSRYEGFGYAALEAMACGKPVIAANNSALPEVVEDGVTGILCDPDHVDCYVTACRRLKQDNELCKLMGENARKRAVSFFGAEMHVRKYIAMYTSLAK